MRIPALLVIAIGALSAPLMAQAPELAVGDQAPDWTLTVATQEGIVKEELTLSSLEGELVVLAFFPRARTRGCTIQMMAYRDRYQELFGDDVNLIAISNDPATDLASWAADEAFPFRFASDLEGVAGRAYGALTGDRSYESRFLYVIGTDGTIRFMMKPFAEIDPSSYETLKETLAQLRQEG
jgi:peroxiredoxin Q/BCP